MKESVALRNPNGVLGALDTSGTNVTSSAYVTLITAVNNIAPCSGVLITNTGAQPLYLATGAAGSEVNKLIIPATGNLIVPMEIGKSTRLSLKSAGGTQSSGLVTATLFV